MHFEPLASSHFPLLLKWLQAPHVRRWWDQGIEWTEARVEKKYRTYVEGYKLSQGIRKPIQGYVIYVEAQPIGYIQVYNPYDFPRKPALTGLPASLLTFDFLIGEANYIGRGIGTQILSQFFNGSQAVPPHEALFVDPDARNHGAIRCYEKVGFIKLADKGEVVWMMKKSTSISQNKYHR